MPAPAITTILLFFRKAFNSLSSSSSCFSSRSSRSMRSVVRGRFLGGFAMRLLLVGGGPSVDTNISLMSGDMLPDKAELALGERYRLDASGAGGVGGEGD